MTPEPLPRQFVVPRAAHSPRATKGQVQFVHVLWPDALGLDVDVAFRFACAFSMVVVSGSRVKKGTAQLPSALQRVPHHRAREHAFSVVVNVQILLGEMMHHVRWLCGGEEADAGAVAEEAEVAVVGYDVDWGGVGGGAGRGGGAGPVVVDGADVAAVEADAGAGAEHGFVGGVEWAEEQRRRGGRREVGADGDVGVQGEGREVDRLR